MCGIMGYTGLNQAQPILINGLKKLEYRGYDSAGIAVHNKKDIEIIKSQGKISELEKKLNKNILDGNLGIGHTRWATHGIPSDNNAHPQMSNKNKIAIVHNGIIENYLELKSELEDNNFSSDTDTEVIAHLIDKYYTGDTIEDFIDAVIISVKKLIGSYALGIICEDFPDKLIAVKKDSPLVIGVSNSENFIASDITALVDYTHDVMYLDDGEIAIIDPKEVTVFDIDKNKIKKEILKVDWDIKSAEKDGYDFFMLKEIYEQPNAIKKFLSDNLSDMSSDDFLDRINMSGERIKNFDRIYIVACGTAYHAGLIGAKLLECLPNIFVSVQMASEFRYSNQIINQKSLVIAISQSGETADTLMALRIAKKSGATTLAIVNVVGSSIAREADSVICISAGPEISVASTKAFSSQVVALYVLVYNLYKNLGIITQQEFMNFEQELKNLPEFINEILLRDKQIENIAKKYITCKNVFYIGRGLDYFIALEGSLKLKEIAYLYSQAYAAGELKHGPIALIDDTILVVGIATQKNILEKTSSNLKECKARNGKILTIAIEQSDGVKNISDDVFLIPKTNEIIAPILANIVLQLFAFHIANGLGCEIDKPRNLAKSVTVE